MTFRRCSIRRCNVRVWRKDRCKQHYYLRRPKKERKKDYLWSKHHRMPQKESVVLPAYVSTDIFTSDPREHLPITIISRPHET